MVNLVKKYLEFSNHGNAKSDFESTYLSHPNYPSLYAITDSLSLLQIENIAIKIPKEQFDELPHQFLTLVRNEFALLQKKNTKVVITPMKGKDYSVSVEEFMMQWDPLVIAIEPNSKKNNVNLNSYKWLSYILPLASLFFLYLLAHPFVLTSIVLFLLSILGLYVGVLAEQEKLGFTNKVTSKICDFSGNNSCESVITSSKGKINKWIEFTDLPIVFFGTNVLLIALLGNLVSTVVSVFSLLAIPVVLYSIWLQKSILKKWCPLCLTISLVIVLQCLFGNYDITAFTSLVASLEMYAIGLLFVAVVWLLWNKSLKLNKSLADQNYTLKRFHRNYSVFKSLCKSVPNLSNFESLSRIPFGNLDAPAKLSLLLSTSCGHCHTAFQDAFTLQRTYPEQFYFEVIFNMNPDNLENPYKIIAESVMSMLYYDVNQAKEAITDWHFQKLHLEAWKEKWVVSDVNFNVPNEMRKQYEWCGNNNFNYTPVKLLNQQIFPTDYELSDLKFFMQSLTEENQTKSEPA